MSLTKNLPLTLILLPEFICQFPLRVLLWAQLPVFQSNTDNPP